MATRKLILAGVLTGLLSACAHSYIPGTQVADTRANRELMSVIEAFRDAMQAGNAESILELVSHSYFENMGTAQESDDYGYEHLKNAVLGAHLPIATEIHVTIRVHDIVVNENKAHADVRYNSRSKLNLPSGPKWSSRKEFNRLEFSKENERWMITSGL